MGNKENNKKKPGFKTLSIHHGETFAEKTGCVMPPIYLFTMGKHLQKKLDALCLLFFLHLRSNMEIKIISTTQDQAIQTLEF